MGRIRYVGDGERTFSAGACLCVMDELITCVSDQACGSGFILRSGLFLFHTGALSSRSLCLSSDAVQTGVGGTPKMPQNVF